MGKGEVPPPAVVRGGGRRGGPKGGEGGDWNKGGGFPAPSCEAGPKLPCFKERKSGVFSSVGKSRRGGEKKKKGRGVVKKEGNFSPPSLLCFKARQSGVSLRFF